MTTMSLLVAAVVPTQAAEPDPSSYWDIRDVKPGMKGVGRTVMVGTKLEDFEAEVLGVLRDVSPGRDMILCRLSGCNLEHAGIIQGMSGSPIYVDGKLLGAVAYAWEFAKDPIAGVTPFSQMVQYSRSSDRRIAAEAGKDGPVRTAGGSWVEDWRISGPITTPDPKPAASVNLGDMRPITMPVAAGGFSPRALSLLSQELEPFGMAPVAGGGVFEEILRAEGDKPLEPGSPLSVAMVTGDFDLSGIGTVTHVEGDRVYGFGHPMFSLGSCALPMMTGYIHTVYPRASVSMKMGSPLKVVGVIDTDVSTGIAGRIGPKPDMLPMTVEVKAGRYSEPSTYNVEIARESKLLPGLVLSVLSNAIDTEGNLPEELTAELTATIELEGRDPIVVSDTLSGPRFSGPLGPSAMFSTISNIVRLLTLNSIRPIRIESITCSVQLDDGRRHAAIESVRLQSHRVEPGQDLRAFVTLKPYKGLRRVIEATLPLPRNLPEGNYEVVFCDMGTSVTRRLRIEPTLREPRDLDAILQTVRYQTNLRHDRLYLHVPVPHDSGLAIQGQALPNLPGSVLSVFTDARSTKAPAIKSELCEEVPTSWVIEGSQAIKFTVVKDSAISMRD